MTELEKSEKGDRPSEAAAPCKSGKLRRSHVDKLTEWHCRQRDPVPSNSNGTRWHLRGRIAQFPTDERNRVLASKARQNAFDLYQELVEISKYEPIDHKDFFVKLDADAKAPRKRLPVQEVTTCKTSALSCWKPYMREYTVDSGASCHIVARGDLTKNEFITARSLAKPIIMETASGETKAEYEADIYVHDLEMYVAAMVVTTPTPPLLSVGSLAQNNEVYFGWSEEGPKLT